MSGGRKNLTINVNERAVSPDVNRLQAFAGADDGELLKYLLGVRTIQGGSGGRLRDIDAGSGFVTADPTIPTNYVNQAEITEGLLVRPNAGTLTIDVDPGLMTVAYPDGDPDASVYKYVRDPGTLLAVVGSTPTPGTITIPANVGTTPVWYVVECQPSLNGAVESGYRDIYNGASFAPVVVSKATRYQLSYRLRAGTGVTMPPPVTGWLPLCMIFAPGTSWQAGGSPSVDAMTFYDVRPLIADRNNLAPIGSDLPDFGGESTWVVDGSPGASVANLYGSVSVAFNGRWVGGVVLPSEPTITTDYAAPGIPLPVNLLGANNVDQTNPFSSGEIAFCYLIFPYGLPRWSRYMNAVDAVSLAVPRLPRSPCGLWFCSPVAPLQQGSRSITSTTLPAWLAYASGLQRAPSAVCVASSVATSSTVLQNTRGTNRNSQVYGNGVPITNNIAGFSLTLGSTVNSIFGGVILHGTHVPSNARQVLLNVSVTVIADFTAGGEATLENVECWVQSSALTLEPITPAFSTFLQGNNTLRFSAATATNTSRTLNAVIWVPLVLGYPVAATPPTTALVMKFHAAVQSDATPPVSAYTSAGASVAVSVVGWEV